MKRIGKRRVLFYALLAAAVLLTVIGVVMLAQTFTHYNKLSLDRQDSQLQEMVSAADRHIAVQLENLGADLSYVLKRRGFVAAEEDWLSGGADQELLARMEENLVSQNSLIHAMLALKDGTVCLSTDGQTDYVFPSGTEGALKPCRSADGRFYLALMDRSDEVVYAALLDVERWFGEMTSFINSGMTRMMLLGTQGKLLLYQWRGGVHISSLSLLSEENCDMQAAAYMLENQHAQDLVTTTYSYTYPGETFVHEMCMTVIPVGRSVNGYFHVALTSDYDEIVRPMQAAAIRLIAYGGMLVTGVLLTVLLMLFMVYQHRSQDRELQRLQEKNEQMQQLLERTRELAHHQRLEAIGTLTASIAHEFNNLLTPIMGYAILTLEGLPEECDELAENVTEIYEASRKAKTIIARLSELSRKNTEADFRPLQLDGLIQRVLEVSRPAQPAHVTTVVRCDPAAGLVEGNDTQLSQMLLNLILNAYHAMAERGGTLTLSTAAEGEGVTLRVEDTGAGIAPEALPHIFEPFFTTKESGRGTGLGLAIVKQVAESHHGGIRVESRAGEGTAFILCFPKAMPNEGES